MARNILAVDLGGTKTHLQIYDAEIPDRLRLVREGILPSSQYSGLEVLVNEFLQMKGEEISAACFGVSGPVVNGHAKIVNLPWEVDSRSLSQASGCPRVMLMNDLETTAVGALHLPSHEFHCLNPGEPFPGNKAVIAAGTGLGQAFLFWDGTKYWPSATEGGHSDFAPQNDFQYGLWKTLRRKYKHVSWEYLLSGGGLHEIYLYLTIALQKTPHTETVALLAKGENPGAVIGNMAVAEKCPVCMEAVDAFAEIYGGQAGNLALTVFALGGVYVGGGIAIKLLPRLLSGRFIQAFLDKGRFEEFMSRIPVHIILNPQTSVIGAAYSAASLI